jgi:transketolase
MFSQFKVEDDDVKALEDIDLIYRTLCAVLYNFAPVSGHPGGSISSGRIAQSLLFSGMDYDFFAPQRADNDLISYAAGHKAMGLYALWALRNELIRTADSKRLPEEKLQLRLEDLLGFRRNPTNATPLFKKFNSKALDGHPTPLTPFIKIATGASGVGVGATVGLALGAMDAYGPCCPRVHMIEGEGGMTPGRVAESMAAAATAQLSNLYLHVDWNQASIDSNNVCFENSRPGDYVQWAPDELAYLNDWNVVYVPNGHDFFQIMTAQKFAVDNPDNKQPTAVIYRTAKGWKYGIEGRSAHGAGHKFCSDGYYAALTEFENRFNMKMPRYCSNPPGDDSVESCFYDTLLTVRHAVENTPSLPAFALRKLNEARARLDARARKPSANAPKPQAAFEADPLAVPAGLRLEPGREITLSEALARALNHLNFSTSGSIIASSADLYGSTSVNLAGSGFAEGFYNAVSNPKSRIFSAGGICEDAMGAIMSGLSSFGFHIGVTSSYAAFIAPLEHIPARLHAIGQQMRRALDGRPCNPFIMINAHAGLKTGEDGPTHADPQALQLLEGNFPKGATITLTPWEPQEVWPLLAAALKARPAVIAPFVTRPAEKIIDRAKAGLPGAQAAVNGIYPLMKANPKQKLYHGTIVLQGNGVTTVFVNEVLPRLREMGLNLNVFYVASKELYDLLDEKEKEELYPGYCALEAMGVTDFTLPTMYFWVRSKEGIERTLHPFKKGRYPCSGKAEAVLKEAGLDAGAQLKAVTDYARFMAGRAPNKKAKIKNTQLTTEEFK